MNQDLEKKKYFYILLVIGFFLAFLYFFFIGYRTFSPIHYYEYYTRSVATADALKNMDFKSFADLYSTYTDSLIVLRTVPFFIFFEPTEFMFFYSNFLFNYFLILLFYYALNLIFDPKKSFLFILFLMSQYFFIELSASFYIDLSYFILSSILFIYLYLFDKATKDYRKYSLPVIFLVFSLFLAKNVSYLLIPFLVVAMIIKTAFSRGVCYREKLNKIICFILLVLSGFILYFIFGLTVNPVHLYNDITYPTLVVTSMGGLPSSAYSLAIDLFKFIMKRGVLDNMFFLMKFKLFPLIIGLYLLVFYNLIRKRNTFLVYLFFLSEIFFIFLFNLLGSEYNLRYFITFYSIYYYLFFDIMIRLIKKFSIPSKFIYGFLILLALVNLAIIFNPNVPINSIYYTARFNLIKDLPFNSKVFIDPGDTPLIIFYSSQIDTKVDIEKYKLFSKYSSRFNYIITENITNADYMICANCEDRYNGKEIMDIFPYSESIRYILIKNPKNMIQ